ncbi:MAG: hypothetical protein ACXWQR_13225, partial [Ktedonobacterales bacterium]
MRSSSDQATRNAVENRFGYQSASKKKTPTSTAFSGVKVIWQPLPVLLLKRLDMLTSMLKGMRHDL